MRRIAPILLLLPLVFAGCTAGPPQGTVSTPRAEGGAASAFAVAADTPQRVRQLPKTVIAADLTRLSANERQVVAKLIEASKTIDEIFLRQVSEENPRMRDQLAKNASRSPLDAAGYEYFVMNKGPWDRLDEDAPFIGTTPKPEGAAFYPADLTKEEFEKYVAANPSQKEQLQSLTTVVRRDGDRLKAIPYSAHYKDLLDPAARALREAAGLTTDASLRNYLTRLATAFGTDDYRESDMAWMDLEGTIETVIGPYEVYEDKLFNYKAAFESFVTIVDKAESEKLAVYARHLPAMERNLPEPDEYKNFNRGSDSPIKVVLELYTAGDARRGVQTSAFNLPNDEFVREKKGSKKVLLKNVMEAKFRQSGRPIAMRVLEPSLTSLVSFDAFFNHVLFHELSHGLGPGIITFNGEKVDARIPLENLYSAIEECKADVLGLWNIRYAMKEKLLSSFDERQLYATYTGLMFRSMRFGISEAHGRGVAVQWNWIRERGGIVPTANGTFTIDVPRFQEAVKTLSTELLTIEATGDFNRARALLDKYGVSNREIDGVIGRLEDIPVDIWPVFPAAGEK